MTAELRKTGISVVGDMPWGTHFCHFYETKEDLLDILIPYFKAGLENNEFCLWVVSDPLGEEEARKALKQNVPEADRYLAAGRIEIVPRTVFLSPHQQTSSTGRIKTVPHSEWDLNGGAFVPERVINGWNEKLTGALADGYAGLRVNYNEAWLTQENWEDFSRYERTLDETLADRRMIVLCSYPLAGAGATEIFDVVHTHRFAIVRRRGNWEVVESQRIKQAKAEKKRLNEELERRVVERTRELAAASERQRREIAERGRCEEALRASESRLQAAIDAVDIGLWEWDLASGQITLLGHQDRLFGFAPGEFDGAYASLERRVHPEDLAELNRVVRRARDEGSEYTHEYRVVWPDGCIHWIAGRGRFVYDGAGRPVRMYGAVLDITERKQVEQVLRRSEEPLRLVIDTIPMMVWSLGPDGTLDFVNKRWLDYTGLSLAESIEQPMRTVHPEDHSRVMEKWLTDMAAGELSEDEMRIRRADGEYRWFLVRTAPLRDEQGNLVKWYGTGVDITGRKRAEEALQIFRNLLNQTGDAIEIIDPTTLRFLDCNESAHRSLGYSREEFLSLSIWDIDPILDQERFTQSNREIEKSGAATFESLHRRKDGSVFPVEVNLQVARLERDYRLAVVRDITERKRAEEEGRRQREIFQKIFDNIPIAITFFDENGRLAMVNRAWERMFGWTLGELEERNLDPVVEALPDPRERQRVFNFMAAGSGEWDEFKARTRDGRTIDVWTTAVRLSDGTGIGLTQDITERKQAEEKLKATTRQLRALSARLRSAREEESTRIAREIHDELGAALSSLRWDLEEIDELIADSTYLPQLAAFRQRIEAMVRLIDTTVDIVRRIASELRPIALDALGLVEAIKWQAQQFQARTGIAVECDCQLEDLDLNREVSTAVFRIFQETLTNILRHARATRVDIMMKQEAGEFLLLISDNGKGITEDEKTATQSLGLLGMRERAHLIGGEINIEGAEGQGTVITVRIPISG